MRATPPAKRRRNGARSFQMLPEEAMKGAQAILAKRTELDIIKVLVDNPNDCKHTISAFRKLGCKVKVEQDGAVLVVTRPGVA